MRVMVDMSVTLLHHGHIRLLEHAKQYGYVIVALTTDEEILRTKGYQPELPYEFRKEILESIKYVDEVVPSNWNISEEFLDFHHAKFLIHGDDNCNAVSQERLLIRSRTAGVSSTELRRRAYQIFSLKS